MKILVYLFIFISTCIACSAYANKPLMPGFVYLDTITPQIVQEIHYASNNNFIGRPIVGYLKPKCIITLAAAHQLSRVQLALNHLNLGLKVFDCYRPQMAVNDFIQWSHDASDNKMQAEYYPRINKADVFKLGYVMAKSGHSRGSTVDLTIINLKDHSELDMGTPYDFMDELSHPLNPHVTASQHHNRLLLRHLMLKYGFVPAAIEWWHFTLRREPYPHTYFNFPVQ